MNAFKQIEVMERMDDLINRKGTGTADDLGELLGMCRRNVFYYFDKLRYYGAEIEFCYHRNSYIYTDDQRPSLPIITKQNANKLRGGESFLNYFSGVQDFCTPPSDLCTKLKDNEEHDEASRGRFLKARY
jgi:hypothetical protein